MRKLSSHRFPHAICNARPREGRSAATFEPPISRRYRERRQLGKFRMNPDTVEGLGSYGSSKLIYVKDTILNIMPRLFILAIKPIDIALEPLAPENSSNGEKFCLFTKRGAIIIRTYLDSVGGILISGKIAESLAHTLSEDENFTIYGIGPEKRQFLFIGDIADYLSNGGRPMPYFSFYALARTNSDLEGMLQDLSYTRKNEIPVKVEIIQEY